MLRITNDSLKELKNKIVGFCQLTEYKLSCKKQEAWLTSLSFNVSNFSSLGYAFYTTTNL